MFNMSFTAEQVIILQSILTTVMQQTEAAESVETVSAIETQTLLSVAEAEAEAKADYDIRHHRSGGPFTTFTAIQAAIDLARGYSLEGSDPIANALYEILIQRGLEES